MEMNALMNPIYDAERFGVHIAASPRHADALVVTGPVTVNMEKALKDVYRTTPDPKLVIALGDCACDCGMFKGSYGVTGPVERHVPVDVKIHGCPPRPAEILNALQHLRKRSDCFTMVKRPRMAGTAGLSSGACQEKIGTEPRTGSSSLSPPQEPIPPTYTWRSRSIKPGLELTRILNDQRFAASADFDHLGKIIFVLFHFIMLHIIGEVDHRSVFIPFDPSLSHPI